MSQQLLMPHMQIMCLCDFDYLILGCGYVHRLHGRLDEIITAEKNANGGIHSFLFLHHQDTLFALQPDEDNVSGAFLKIRDHLGYVKESVCLKGNDGDVDYAVDSLRKLGHCACWGDKPSKVVSFFTKNGKKVLYEEYDTESG